VNILRGGGGGGGNLGIIRCASIARLKTFSSGLVSKAPAIAPPANGAIVLARPVAAFSTIFL
jgi:hypothetical protein